MKTGEKTGLKDQFFSGFIFCASAGGILERPLFLWLKYLKHTGKCGMININILI